MALRKSSPAAGEFLFEIDPEPLEEQVTALGGIPLLVRAARSLDVPGSVERHLRLKQRERGFDEARYVESFLVLNAVGGDCLEDFDQLREDAVLAEMLGHAVPSAEAARKFLYQFHDGEKIEQAQQALAADRVSYIPEENPALQGLGQVNQDVVRELGRRCAEQKIATLDVDATIIESWKREAKPTYEGSTGYQPVLALWAEMSVVVGDEFRDGNVPAHQELLPITQRAFQALPETVVELYFRGDSACHEQSLLEWLCDEQRAGGPQGRIGFAVSAGMNPALHAEIAATLESRWQPYSENSMVVKECCEVDYVPEETGNPYREPLRYVAIRIRKKQQALFRGRQHGEVLRRGQQCVGVDAEAVAGMASRKSRLDRSGTRRDQERAGWRGDALRTLRSQCRLAAAGGVDPQRADRVEAVGPAAGVAHGTAQATAFSYLQHSWKISASRAQHPVAIGVDLATLF